MRLIEEQIAKRAATAEAASTAKLETAATTVAQADQAKSAPRRRRKWTRGRGGAPQKK